MELIPVYITIFLFGIVIGSFLNVCILRIPEKESIVTVPSHCTHCGYQLSWYDLIPLFSYILLGGKCRKCKRKISPQYPIIEAVNGIVYVAIFALRGFKLESCLDCFLFSSLLVLSIIDFRTYEIPIGINGMILLLGIVKLILKPYDLKNCLIGFLAVSLVLFLLQLLSKGRAIGGGDVKLMAVCCLYLGWELVILSFFLGCIYGAVIHLIRMKVSNEDHVLAMGPYLSAGVMTSLFFGEWLITEYLALL